MTFAATELLMGPTFYFSDFLNKYEEISPLSGPWHGALLRRPVISNIFQILRSSLQGFESLKPDCSNAELN